MQEQIGFLTGKRKESVESFTTSGVLPDPVTKDFVEALNQIFQPSRRAAALRHRAPGGDVP